MLANLRDCISFGKKMLYLRKDILNVENDLIVT